MCSSSTCNFYLEARVAYLENSWCMLYFQLGQTKFQNRLVLHTVHTIYSNYIFYWNVCIRFHNAYSFLQDFVNQILLVLLDEESVSSKRELCILKRQILWMDRYDRPCPLDPHHVMMDGRICCLLYRWLGCKSGPFIFMKTSRKFQFSNFCHTSKLVYTGLTDVSLMMTL